MRWLDMGYGICYMHYALVHLYLIASSWCHWMTFALHIKGTFWLLQLPLPTPAADASLCRLHFSCTNTRSRSWIYTILMTDDGFCRCNISNIQYVDSYRFDSNRSQCVHSCVLFHFVKSRRIIFTASSFTSVCLLASEFLILHRLFFRRRFFQ